MIAFRNEKGFTLIELIITIVIISVMVSSVGYTLNTLFVSEIDGIANEIVNTIRDVRVESMSSVDEKYLFELKKEADGYYYYIKKDEGTITTLQSVKISGRVKIQKEVAGTVYDIGDTTPVLTTGTQLTIQFDKATGRIVTDGAGTYIVEHINTGEKIKIVISKETGGGTVVK